MTVAAAHNRQGGLMAVRGGIELPVSYATLALTLAATGPGKYKIGPSLPGKLTAIGVLVGGALAGALIARMLTAEPPASEEPAPAAPPAPSPEQEPVQQEQEQEPAPSSSAEPAT
jgi:hypothetical protein